MTEAEATDPVVDDLKAQLSDLFLTEAVSVIGDGPLVSLEGELVTDAETTFQILENRLQSRGYLPILKRVKGRDTILLAPAPTQKRASRPWVNLILFLATVATVTFGGALMEGYNPLADPPSSLLRGLPFAGALLGILVTHEAAHFLTARAHGMRASLPYFIPVPFSTIGTFGAMIRMESPIKNRKALLDVGLSGPLAGLVVALVVLVVGLRHSQVMTYLPDAPLMPLGTGLLVDWITEVVLGPLRDDSVVVLHPIALAGWFGVFITFINLIPISQLDGGHVGYAFFGPSHRLVAMLVFGVMLVLGLFSSWWFLWAVVIFFLGGLRHPPPLNDITPLDGKRRILAMLSFVLLFLLGTPRPFG